MWVGCWWCTLDTSPEHYAQRGVGCLRWWITAASMKCKDRPVCKHGCCCESSYHPPLLALRRIIHIFANSYESCVAPRFWLGSQFFLSVLTSLQIPCCLPVGSRCTVIPLPSHLLHPHAHLLSVSHWATLRPRERARATDEKESLVFNHTPLWSHLLTLISPLHIWSAEFALC